MTTVQVLQKKVEKLEQVLAPKPKGEIWVVFSFGSHDESHGKYGYRRVNIHTGKVEAMPEREELEMLREGYVKLSEKLTPEIRERASYWATWENFLEYNRCKCGKHG